MYEEAREGAVSASRRLRALQVAVTLWAKSAWGKAEMRGRLEDMYVRTCTYMYVQGEGPSFPPSVRPSLLPSLLLIPNGPPI